MKLATTCAAALLMTVSGKPYNVNPKLNGKLGYLEEKANNLVDTANDKSKFLFSKGITGELTGLFAKFQDGSAANRFNDFAGKLVKVAEKYNYGDEVKGALDTVADATKNANRQINAAANALKEAPANIKKEFGRKTLEDTLQQVAQKAAELMPEYVENEAVRDELFYAIRDLRTVARSKAKENKILKKQVNGLVRRGQNMIAGEIENNKDAINTAAENAENGVNTYVNKSTLDMASNEFNKLKSDAAAFVN